MRRDFGFTLIEIVLAVFILMLVLMLAVPSLSGVLADQRLRRSLNRFNELVNTAHEQSVAEHRSYLVVV
ncbi:MAG TPA: prepilin-type N-terminal cleavage/methylation domain-containing protein, partial [Chthoniobacterales bacterium]|nr:prepilin-type N-terminal cleavage/methylation domain-containing protein [Chthoniobacterales bacterium]